MSDCCAYTELQEFLLNPDAVDHVIIGVGTTDRYTTWHINVVEVDDNEREGSPDAAPYLSRG